MGRVYGGIRYPYLSSQRPERGLTPSDQWALHRLTRERYGLPESDAAKARRDIQKQAFDQKKAELEMVKSVLDMSYQRFKDSNSIAEKELIRDRMLMTVRQLPKADQILFNNLLPMSPEMARSFKALDFAKAYGTPKEVNPEWQESAPGRWAADTWYNKQLDQLKAKYVDGIEPFG